MTDEQAMRQSGRTTEQMRSAPVGALYVWPHARIDYPRALAEHLGRTDLEIVTPSIFRCGASALRGRRLSIVLDHATDLSRDEFDGYNLWRICEMARG